MSRRSSTWHSTCYRPFSVDGYFAVPLGATAAGAILGRAIGDRDRRSAVGALIGAAIGTGVATRRGEAIELPAGDRLTLALDKPVEVTVRARVLEVG